MSQSTHGGARRGAGRKPSPERLVRIDARLSRHQIEFLKSISPNLSKAIRTIIEKECKVFEIYDRYVTLDCGHEVSYDRNIEWGEAMATPIHIGWMHDCPTCRVAGEIKSARKVQVGVYDPNAQS